MKSYVRTPGLPVTSRLVEVATTLDLDDLTSSARRDLHALLLDGIACCLDARRFATGAAAVAATAGLVAAGSSPIPSLLGPSTGHPSMTAAFVNGALAHALNHDAYGRARGPLGAVVVPAAFSVAPAGVSGRELLRAIAVGAEIGNRLGTAAQDASHLPDRSAFLAGGIEGQLLGTTTAAVTAGSILGLDTAQMHSALGLALMQTAGSAQIMLDGDAPAKGFYGGFATAGGVTAALAAKAGVDGRCAAIEGTAGLIPRFFPGAEPERAVEAPLGEPAGDVVFKRWPCSSIVAPYVEAAIKVHRNVDHTSIEAVQVLISPNAVHWCTPLDARRYPVNSACATNSIPFAVAVALVHGDFRPEHLSPEALRDPRVCAVAAAVEYREVEPSTARTLLVRLRGGSTTTVQGTGEVHLGPADVPNKLRAAATCSHISDESAKAVIAVVEELDELPDLTALASALSEFVPSDGIFPSG